MNKALRSLEYNKVILALTEHAVSLPGKDYCSLLEPMQTIEDAQRALNETLSAEKLLLSFSVPSFSNLTNIKNACQRAQSGAVLSITELLQISRVLKTAEGLYHFLKNQIDEDNPLYGYYLRLVPNKYLSEKLASAFVNEEEVADSASSLLRDIRRKQLAAKNKVRSSLDDIIHSQTKQKYLQENIITVRNGRFVIPVKAEYRNEISGLVHDTSSSGATLFIEPLSVVSANNDLAVLDADEHREIERILAEFSAEVGTFCENITEDFEVSMFMDFCFAKARYADCLKATRPILNLNGYINLKTARHPLIKKEECVPIDIELGKDYTALIVTGPNTGGKTVSLKTTGLICLMAKSGLFVPTKEDAQVGFFDEIFADIGDEQSIEQSLSTFSAHMSNIINIVGKVSENTLVLLDELGSGTDPEEGAALAIAIIEHVQSMGAKIIATTHYAELKLYALQTPFVENASCEFDVATLKPTYRLITGIPGKSNAFAIAKRLGLDDIIIDSAKFHMNTESIKFEKVIADLEINKKTVERDALLAEEMRKKAEDELLKARQLMDKYEQTAESKLDEARQKAADIVDVARRQSDRILDELDMLRKEKEKADYKDKISKTRGEISERLEKTQKEIGVKAPKIRKPISRPLLKGDAVKVISLNKQGIVNEDPKGKKLIQVVVGIINMKIPITDLELSEQKTQYDYKMPSVSIPLTKAGRNIQTELDIRGMNVLDADGLIDEFLDNCSLSNLNVVSIIHGKGTGVLREAVQEKLKRNRLVREYRLGVYGEGESGVTIVTLK